MILLCERGKTLDHEDHEVENQNSGHFHTVGAQEFLQIMLGLTLNNHVFQKVV